MAIDSSEDVKNRYASESETYRKDAPLVNFESEDFFIQMMSYIQKLYPDTDRQIKVLDIGAGTGMLTERLMNIYPQAHVTMLDYSEEMLKSGMACLDRLGIKTSNINFHLSDFVKDALPETDYDLVISSFALHHIRNIKDLQEVYQKIYSVLKPNCGTFLCVDIYLECEKKYRLKQARTAIAKWQKNFNIIEAKKWAKIIESEDTSATIPTILSSINAGGGTKKLIELLTPQSGIMTTLYGFTKLSLKELKEKGLENLLVSDHLKQNISGTLSKTIVYDIAPYPLSEVK